MRERKRFVRPRITYHTEIRHAGENMRTTKRTVFRTTIVVFLFLALFLTACSNMTGLRIPGTEKSAVPTTIVYLVLENVETIPEHLRTEGEIFVDDAFFGCTTRPVYNRFVGNALVVGKVQIEKEKIHTVQVVFPGYEPFEHRRYFGTLPEYSIPFRLKRIPGEPVTAWDEEPEPPRTDEEP